MMRSGSPFLLIPWQADFLERLLHLALEDTNGDIGRAVFLFPNSRPEKYLSLLLRHDKRVQRPLIMPRTLTIASLFSGLRSRILARPAWNAGLLDRVGLLLACVREENALAEPLEWDFTALGDAGRFFPWGLRLADLFEECFSQHRKPGNFLHAEGAVSPFAAALLSRLGHIFNRYAAGLEEREWTTPGLDASITADYLREHGSLPDPGLGQGPVYICGFHALTGTENLLFRHLWERGAKVVIHADPALLRPWQTDAPEPGHWSCGRFSEWAGSWRTRIEPVDSLPGDAAEAAPCLRCCQGFDLHSQLAVLEEELAGLADSGASSPQPEDIPEDQRDMAADTVVVLPDSGLLMPVLHHLPRADINISMGYPLARSPLFRLLDTLARLQTGRRAKGYYWRDLVDLIRHPYLKMLRPENGESSPDKEDDAPLRRELHRLERAVREHGRRYPEPLALLEQMYQMLGPEDLPPAPVLALLERLFRVCLANFENPATPRDLGRALEELCSLLLDHGGHLWKRFLIDAECLFRIMQSLIPELSHSGLATEQFPAPALFVMLRRLMEAERVPFEASPLVGLQIMGMLETRLLRFRRVVIVDAGEHSLPGSPAGDPLLPEALRPELGLPSLGSREQVAAYHFFRLIAGAEDVLLLWEESSDAPGSQGQKKKKSRFVEELLWREEKKLGRLLAQKGRDGPLSVLTASVVPIPRHNRSIAVTEAVHDLLLRVLAGPVSASLLDSYLRCPVQFYFQRLAGLAPAEAVTEGDDPLAVGELLHQVLQEAYRPHLGIPLPGGEELLALLGPVLEDEFLSSPAYEALVQTLPADSAHMLRIAAKKRLNDYLLRQPPGTVLALETRLAVSRGCLGRSFSLYGKADRIDLRPLEEPDRQDSAGVVILDYKTGRVPEMKNDVWEDAALWDRLASWRPGPGEPRPGAPEPLLAELAERLRSVQLPFYLLLYSLGGAASGDAALPAPAAHDAAFVQLALKGEEIALFPKKFSSADRALAVANHCSLLVDFLLRHMLQSDRLSPRPGSHCRWCSSAKLCISTVQ